MKAVNTKHTFLSAFLVLVVVLVVVATMRLSTASAEATAADLLWDCEQPAVGSSDMKRFTMFARCMGYVQGASDTMTLIMSVIAPGNYCPPEKGMSNDQVSRIVLKWIKEHPEAMHESARMAIFTALKRAFPCPSPPPAVPPTRKQRALP